LPAKTLTFRKLEAKAKVVTIRPMAVRHC